MGRHDRKSEIRRRRLRRQKLAKLRQRYAAARSEAERNKIWEKALRISPTITREDFLAPLQRSA